MQSPTDDCTILHSPWCSHPQMTVLYCIHHDAVTHRWLYYIAFTMMQSPTDDCTILYSPWCSHPQMTILYCIHYDAVTHRWLYYTVLTMMQSPTDDCTILYSPIKRSAAWPRHFGQKGKQTWRSQSQKTVTDTMQTFHSPAFSWMAVSKILSQGVITPRSITLSKCTTSKVINIKFWLH